jgi:hypothetical protein
VPLIMPSSFSLALLLMSLQPGISKRSRQSEAEGADIVKDLAEQSVMTVSEAYALLRVLLIGGCEVKSSLLLVLWSADRRFPSWE